MQLGWLNPVNSLAGRIFIWFWLVLMLTVALTLLLSRQLIEDTDIRRLPPSITAQLQQQILQWQQLPDTRHYCNSCRSRPSSAG